MAGFNKSKKDEQSDPPTVPSPPKKNVIEESITIGN